MTQQVLESGQCVGVRLRRMLANRWAAGGAWCMQQGGGGCKIEAGGPRMTYPHIVWVGAHAGWSSTVAHQAGCMLQQCPIMYTIAILFTHTSPSSTCHQSTGGSKFPISFLCSNSGRCGYSVYMVRAAVQARCPSEAGAGRCQLGVCATHIPVQRLLCMISGDIPGSLHRPSSPPPLSWQPPRLMR